ncbi:MAG: cysteine desulfurase [Gemmatimonadota bacterium]|nr:cysteine desulfurase [Gemmatimonadota bacterium]MDH3368353.1 cysteine desulfurase [Gemmatimonadota bacterium]MDH3476936.1 cysteine desulfurase [Gemmatimonadota bacterium]MDH3569217.1 cysteine desulfurase [Gemmatimonadota bacterium]MDH5551469.1 cysteine desulfurase [Gemmatimonadota bacterium]
MRQVSTPLVATRARRDVATVRQDFPVLSGTANGRPLVYLDNAATSQKPRAVIESLVRFYQTENANIHRGVHELSQRATLAYEAARAKLQRFLNAGDPHEVIFVRGATEAINLVASSFGRIRFRPGDEVVVSAMEHHSNLVPWQIACEIAGARLRVIPMSDAGELDLDALRDMLGDRTRLVAVVHVSNSLGTINPVTEIVRMAHDAGAPVLVDGAQAAPHMPIDVQELDADFYALSGHKMFGPTGIGVLYGKAKLLEAMPPYQGGGEMIRSVTFEKTTYAPLPAKFEAGTPHIAGAIGLGAAVDYLRGLSWEWIQHHEHDLLEYATEQLRFVPGLRIVGTAARKAAVISFVLEGVHAHDIGTILDQSGIAIRTGHHCTQPVMDRLGIPATARASFAFYNTREEVDALVRGVQEVRAVFG